MTDARSIVSTGTDSSAASEAEEVEKSSRSRKSSAKSIAQRKSVSLLDSNGESDDEEINKLQKIIQDQAKELNEERLASKKLRQVVKLLKRETKQLQLKQQQNQQNQQQTKDSDSEAPPWEKRKLESRLADIEKLIHEKNAHIEQLLRDCRSLERENQECNSKIQELSQQFAECTQQLQIATQNYETLEETYKERIVQLESEIDRTRIRLDECQLQKEVNEENLDKISDAVDFTINKCREIIMSKERTIEMLEARLQSSPGKMAREEEVERLRDELAAAAKEIEESARLIEEFQSLPVTGGASISASGSSLKRKLRQLESIKESKLESERLLAERDEQVAELTRLVHRYETGAYGLSEATRELRDVREQVRVRDAHIERLVEQLNCLEERLEDVALENNDLRKTCGIEEGHFDVSLARVTLAQQIDEAKAQVERLKGENMQLGLENRSLKRALLKAEKAPSPRPPSVNEKLLTDYQKACSEVIVLRKGLVEILQSVREQDGTSDVKIESPILERLVRVLNSERLFGHYDAYVDLMNENSSVHGENKALRERIRELRSAPPTPTPRTPQIDRATSGERVVLTDQAVQVIRDVSDAFNNISIDLHGLGREEAEVQTSEDFPTPEAYKRETDLVNELKRQVLEYERQLNELERQLGEVRVDLIRLGERHETSSSQWREQERNLVDEISRKDTRVEELETELAAIKDISMHEKSLQVDDSEFLSDDQPVRQKSVELDEEKIQMEKEITTLKVRLEHKEKTLRRAQEFLDEVRQEQLRLIEDHSQEVLNLQETILEQQRALHRIEQAQREMAASAASSRAVVRHLETEVDSSHQLHAKIAELTTQLETVRKQGQQWKQAAEMLSKEKQLLRESLKADHDLEMDQMKRNIKANEDELEEFRAKTSELQRQLTEERIDKQRGTLLQVLVAKLKTELDRKEKQMEFLKQIAEEMNARLEMNGNQAPLITSTPVPAHNDIPISSPPNEEEMSKNMAEFEQRHAQLEKAVENQRKLLESSHNRERTLKEQLKEQTALVEKLQDEKATVSRQLVALRNRVTRMSSEKVAAQTTPDDVCRLLKRIKELEGQLAMFHTAEKPTDEPLMLAKSLAMDQWKERKKMQTVLDQLKVKSRELQERLLEEERSKDGLRKTINRLVNEKRSLEDKLKFKANDNERIRLLVQENTQWRLRFEGLEDRLRQMERLNDEDSDASQHRLQIAVLQEKLRKQDAQLTQLQARKTPTPQTSTNCSTNVSMSEDAIAKFQLLNNVEVKLKENIQRLANLVQLPRSGSDRRISFQEEPPMTDIRRTVRVLHQLIYKLSYIKDNSL